jgi:hypothetical protein
MQLQGSGQSGVSERSLQAAASLALTGKTVMFHFFLISRASVAEAGISCVHG